jgi:hypothetical protein
MYYVDVTNATGTDVRTTGPYASEQKAAHEAARWRGKGYRATIRHEPDRRAPEPTSLTVMLAAVVVGLLVILALATVGGDAMTDWQGILALTIIALCVTLVAIADAIRERAKADQMTAQACAVCTEHSNNCAAVCGTDSDTEDNR